jgi:1,4-alpha-glucan branching enzyme
MKRLLLLCVSPFFAYAIHAQLLTWSPPFPEEANTSQSLVIIVDASKGNKGLLNYVNTSDVYVHTGVITSLSSSSSDWKYSRFDWGTTNSAAKAAYLGGNKWSFTISGSLRAFYGITNASETIQKIAILFRNGDGSKVQRNSDGSDMYLPVYSNAALAVRLDQPAREPRFIPVPEAQSWTVGSSVTVQAASNKPASLKLFHNAILIAQATNAQTVSGMAAIAAEGPQQFIAEASNGTTTTRDTLAIFVAPSTSPTAPLPAGVRNGINYEAGDTSAVLVLHAPGKNIVTVIGDFNNWTESTAYIMNKTPDGATFWLRLKGLTKGVEYAYQYYVDGSLKIADPYTEKILDPNNDPFIPATTYPSLKPYPTGKTTGIASVLQTAAPTYTWTNATFNRPDKRGLVIYELLLRDFVAAHDWKTLRDTLGYLKRLGINAIEVMPFNEFEGNISWGYNSDFYFAPDKYYGTKNSLKEAIDVCHSNGIAVIMDIVLNHSYGPSPLAQLYWDAQAGRPAAANPWYNPVQPHAFGFGDDFNHESAHTKDFFNRVLQHWITEYKIDGYRFDFSKGLTQKASSDNTAFSAYDASRVAIITGYANTIKAVDPNAYFILEHFADNMEEKQLADSGFLLWGNLNYNYNEAAMGYMQNSNFEWGIYTTRTWTAPHLVTYMESHDEERLMYKNVAFGNGSNTNYKITDTATALKRIELDAAFFFTIPGPKMIWQFGELGYDYPINYCADGSVNNNCRVDPKPIRWDYYNEPRRRHVYTAFSDLIKLRFHPWYKDAFMSGRVEQNVTGPFKWLKVTTDTSNLLVVGNFDVAPVTGSVTFQSAGTWYDYLNHSIYTTTGTAQSITLQPGEFHVYINRNVNNTTTTATPDLPWNESGLAIRAFPNPVQASLTVNVNLPQNGNVQLQLLNGNGQKLATLQEGHQLKGPHRFTFSRSSLPVAAGLYFLQVATKTGIKSTSIILQ